MFRYVRGWRSFLLFIVDTYFSQLFLVRNSVLLINWWNTFDKRTRFGITVPSKEIYYIKRIFRMETFVLSIFPHENYKNVFRIVIDRLYITQSGIVCCPFIFHLNKWFDHLLVNTKLVNTFRCVNNREVY